MTATRWSAGYGYAPPFSRRSGPSPLPQGEKRPLGARRETARIYQRATRVVCVSRSRSKRANHFGTICEKWMAKKRRLKLERTSWHDATFQNGTPVEIKSTMHEHADGQPGNWKVYRKYHEKLRRHNGWYCFVIYKPHDRSELTILQDKMVRSANLPLLRWHGGGDHRETD